jgi:Icc protein
MPIHLAPIPRRRFLARTLAAGAGLTLVPELLAGAKQADPDTWALLSDIHVAADRALKVRGINMTEHFRAVCGEVLALPRLPAGMFVNGDCAYNSGHPGDYALVADMLEPIRGAQIPVHLTVGNHDDREHFWEAFQEERQSPRLVRERQVSLLRTPRANWFMLDSLEKTMSTPGLVGPEQLHWLAETLDANPDKPALVLVHHNPGLDGGNMGLKDTLAFLEVIRPRKQVKAYIYGHTHSWKIEQDSSGIHFINLPAVSYVFREGEPSGWTLANLGADGIRLKLSCLDPTHKQNGQNVNLKWRS